MVWNTYFANVESRLRYGIMFWGSDRKSIRIFQLQKKVIKFIMGTHKLNHVDLYLGNLEY